MDYLSAVERFFLSLKGSGLALSAGDYDLILEWERRRVPLERLCRAIAAGWEEDRAAARPGRARPTLSRLRDRVEQELEQTTR